jgi:nicotinamidase/pyrazinamidase
MDHGDSEAASNSRISSSGAPSTLHRKEIDMGKGSVVFGLISLVVGLLLAATSYARPPLLARAAVLVVDVQPCFVEGGSLAVAGADAAYVRAAQNATAWLHHKGFLVLGSRDYHPDDHMSFAENNPGHQPFDLIQLPDGRFQVLWPAHCTQTSGDSRALVDNNLFFELVKKGQNPDHDSYSAFQDDGGKETELHAILQKQEISNLIVYGIATDYCVKASVLDALDRGYAVTVVSDLIRGVASGTSLDAIAEMKAAGAKFVETVYDLKFVF